MLMAREKRIATKRPVQKRAGQGTALVDIIPYIFIVAVVPLIVYLYLDNLEPIEVANWKGSDQYPDFLSWWKSRWFIIASSAGQCLFVFRIIQGRVRIGWKPGLHIPAALYIILIILSTVTSEYVSIALSGFVARYEGMFVLLFYILNMLVVSTLINEEGQVRILFGALLVSASIMCLLGLTQLAGRDFFSTSFGKSFILPAKYAPSQLSFKFGNMVYGTLSNPNYMGSYAVLVLPIAVASVFLARGKGLRIAAAVLSVLLLVNLVGSRSDAGLVGLGAGAVVAVIFFRKKIFRNKIIIALFLAVVLAGAGFAASRVLSGAGAGAAEYYLEDMVFEGNTAKIVSSTETLVITYEKPHLYFYDTDNNRLEIDMSEDGESTVIRFRNPAYQDYSLKLTGDILKVRNNDVELYLRIRQDSLALVGNAGNDVVHISKPEAINVRGYEKLGSARIYIWSRVIPLLKNSILAGYGPDTFTIKFPQDDYIGKVNAYGTPNMIVDKPHNLYLQIAVNTGLVSLLAFLALVAVYIVSSVKLYFARDVSSAFASYGTSVFIGICSYLVTGLFNDSVVAVASVFWILLGTGFACNSMSARERQ